MESIGWGSGIWVVSGQWALSWCNEAWPPAVARPAAAPCLPPHFVPVDAQPAGFVCHIHSNQCNPAWKKINKMCPLMPQSVGEDPSLGQSCKTNTWGFIKCSLRCPWVAGYSTFIHIFELFPEYILGWDTSCNTIFLLTESTKAAERGNLLLNTTMKKIVDSTVDHSY